MNNVIGAKKNQIKNYRLIIFVYSIIYEISYLYKISKYYNYILIEPNIKYFI